MHHLIDLIRESLPVRSRKVKPELASNRSAYGPKRTLDSKRSMSAYRVEADTVRRCRHFRVCGNTTWAYHQKNGEVVRGLAWLFIARTRIAGTNQRAAIRGHLFHCASNRPAPLNRLRAHLQWTPPVRISAWRPEQGSETILSS